MGEIDRILFPFLGEADVRQVGDVGIRVLPHDAAHAKFVHPLAAFFPAHPEGELRGAAQIVSRPAGSVSPIVGRVLPIHARPSFGAVGLIIHA